MVNTWHWLRTVPAHQKSKGFFFRLQRIVIDAAW